MADDEDDEVMPDADDEFEEDEEIDPDELDEEDLDEEVLVADDDEFGELDDEFTEADEDDDEDDDDTSGPVRRAAAGEEEDDDDELLAPDDVEADLDTILKDRMVAAEDEDESEDEPEDRGEGGDRLQPKRADERLCPRCFLLVRKGAPACPVGDDDCPLFR